MAADCEKIIVGNWKMHKTLLESVDFVTHLSPLLADVKSKVYLAVPYTLIKPVSDVAKGTSIVVGAQNMNDASEGAFTGEIAAKMIKDAGGQFVILGHSERRRIFNEDSAFINRKVKRALQDALQPIVCIGETLEERESNQTAKVIEEQLYATLDGINEKQLSSLIIAYEPVWAIGTGKVATPKQAQEVHAQIRQLIVAKWKNSPPILYGGSVTADTAKDLLSQSDIDGLLVGGASLSVDTFSKIIKAG